MIKLSDIAAEKHAADKAMKLAGLLPETSALAAAMNSPSAKLAQEMSQTAKLALDRASGSDLSMTSAIKAVREMERANAVNADAIAGLSPTLKAMHAAASATSSVSELMASNRALGVLDKSIVEALAMDRELVREPMKLPELAFVNPAAEAAREREQREIEQLDLLRRSTEASEQALADAKRREAEAKADAVAAREEAKVAKSHMRTTIWLALASLVAAALAIVLPKIEGL